MHKNALKMIKGMVNLISLFIGLGALAIGLAALFLPERSSGHFGIRAKGDAAAYVRVSGARDVFIGLIFVYFYFRHDRSALSLICFFTAFVSGSDFFITRAHGSKLPSYFHLAATVAVIVYGIILRVLPI
jgi:hypothetical protein